MPSESLRRLAQRTVPRPLAGRPSPSLRLAASPDTLPSPLPLAVPRPPSSRPSPGTQADLPSGEHSPPSPLRPAPPAHPETDHPSSAPPEPTSSTHQPEGARAEPPRPMTPTPPSRGPDAAAGLQRHPDPADGGSRRHGTTRRERPQVPIVELPTATRRARPVGPGEMPREPAPDARPAASGPVAGPASRRPEPPTGPPPPTAATPSLPNDAARSAGQAPRTSTPPPTVPGPRAVPTTETAALSRPVRPRRSVQVRIGRIEVVPAPPMRETTVVRERPSGGPLDHLASDRSWAERGDR